MSMNDNEKARIENMVRTTAIVAAKGAPLDDAFLSKLAAEASDPKLSDADRLAMAKSQAEQHVGVARPLNLLSATPRELAAREMAGSFLPGRFVNGQVLPRTGEGDAGGRSGSSGNRFAEIDKTIMQAREMAMTHNMPWVANNPDLLRLGPSAVKALADVHLREETYRRLTKEADFKAKDVVTLSKYAKEKKVDANELGGAVADVNKDLTKTERERHNKALLEFMGAKPEDAKAARAKLDKVHEDISHAHPERKPKLENIRKIMKLTDKEAATRNEAVKNETKAGGEKKTDKKMSANAEALFGGAKPDVKDEKAKPKAIVALLAPGK
jgi:hypothetical protein